MLACGGNVAAHAFAGLFAATFMLQVLAALAMLVIGIIGIGHMF